MTGPTESAAQRPRIRLAELLAALSLGIDLGFGQPMEHVLRQVIIALRLAERAGLSDDERSDVFYTAMLINVGCHTDAHEQAKWFGDDIALKANKYDYPLSGPRGAIASLKMLGAGNPPIHRFRIGLEFVVSGHRDLDQMVEQHAAIARLLAVELGLPASVQNAVGMSYEQWDGKGWPGEVRGEQVPIAARVSQMSEFMEVADRVGGVDAAVALADKRAGGQFDPNIAATFCLNAPHILDGLDAANTWDAVINSQPALDIVLSDDEFDAALTAIADFVDLKSPYTLGHARAVSSLAGAAARQLGMPESEIRLVQRAGLALGIGRLGVSNAIWDKPGPLGAGEWERVRMHPYLTSRMLRQSTALAPLGEIAHAHRERLDGSGYPRGLAGPAISRPARLLGAVDAYQAMREPRPYRPARTPEAAAAELQADVRAGRLDAECVAAVLGAAGHRMPRRVEWPAGLMAREIDVLRLVARGMSAKDVAAKLVISPKTARNHIEHIYAKIGATSRVTASLFATQHGLLSDDPAG